MIKNNFFVFSLFLFAEMLERFSYYFVSFIFLLFMFANQDNGGLGFSQEGALKLSSYFSFGILFFPLLLSPFIDRVIGYKKAILYGGCCLVLSYALALLSSYFIPSFVVVSLALCVVGSSLIKPTMSTLVGRLSFFANRFQDIAYILFIVIVNIGSLASAYIAAKIIREYTSFRPFFTISMFLMLTYSAIMFYICKRIELNLTSTQQNMLANKKENKTFTISLILCLLIGISTSLSGKIFSLPNSFSFWLLSLIGITLSLFVWFILRKRKNSMCYFSGLALFLTLFLGINLFFKQIGSIAPVLPSLFSTLDMSLNFFIFPIFLSFIFQYGSHKYQVTCQALALFLFSIASLGAKNVFFLFSISSNMQILAISFITIVVLSIYTKVTLKLNR